MRFTADYGETVTLDSGTSVTLRLVRPEDKDQLQRGLARMSPRSRVLRFFIDRGAFTPSELTYLTELDGNDHFAIAAFVDGQGVGVARFIRTEHDGPLAEAAVAVVDAYQKKGLGRQLLVRLVEAARERGVLRFHADVMMENRGMVSLFREVATGKVEESYLGSGVVTLDMPIASPSTDSPRSPQEAPSPGECRWPGSDGEPH